MKRTCIICDKERHTTNQRTEYVCEICYRTKGRELLLMEPIPQGLKLKPDIYLFLAFVLVLIAGFLLGSLIS